MQPAVFREARTPEGSRRRDNMHTRAWSGFDMKPQPRPPKRIRVPAGEARVVSVKGGQYLRLTTPSGAQAADFFAYSAADTGEWLSAAHTWSSTRVMEPREGQTFLSCFRRPLLIFAEDGAGGVHDMLIAACDAARYREFGFEGHHRSCAENLVEAMAGRGDHVTIIPQPFNFFTNTRVTDDQRLVSPPNPVPAGSYVALRALVDLVCAVSACPFDLSVDWWPINAPDGPTDLVLEVT